jgi:hypothetical protein
MPSIEVGNRKGWDMRDIRADLQERLDAVGRDREDLQRRISEIDQIETVIKALLKRESENFGATSPAVVERDFGSFGAKDAMSKDDMSKEAMSVVRPGHWGELRVG